MIQYPLSFEVSAESTSGIQSSFQAVAENLPPITCAIPQKFHGPGGGYSPEDLYALSVVTCFIASFKVFAERTKLEYNSIKGNGELIVDRDAKGKIGIQRLDMTFALNGVKDENQTKKILAEAEKFCLVSNAITIQKNFSYIFTA